MKCEYLSLYYTSQRVEFQLFLVFRHVPSYLNVCQTLAMSCFPGLSQARPCLISMLRYFCPLGGFHSG